MSVKEYIPNKEILKKYADVLVNFALGGGTGIKPGEVVRVDGSEASRALYLECLKAVWDAGGHAIGAYSHDTYNDEDNTGRYFYEHANEEQIKFFAKDYYRGLAKQMDHQLVLLSETNYKALSGVDPKKMMRKGEATKLFHDWTEKKESAGKFTWTLGLYGTEVMAREAKMSIEEYWGQIISACFLDEADPIAKWREVSAEIERTIRVLNEMKIEWVHMTGEDMDLRVKLGADRAWNGGSGRNIPSFEIFTSPDWRGTEGWARFNQPLYRYGDLIEGVELKFSAGKVVEAKATKNEKLLKEMLATKGADKLGEFSLTDARHSRITKFMAETLFDENIGGQYGNTHVAVGQSYHDCYAGDPSKVRASEWKAMGYNTSSVHTDIVSTINRTVTATLADGSERVIYMDGKFQV